MSESCERFRAALDGGAPLDAAAQGHVLGCPACRARLEREERLDTLLDALPADAGPDDLAERVTGALDLRLESALDRLLDAVPADVPAGLAARVLAGLEPERRPVLRPTARGTRLRRLAVPLALAAAALLLVLALRRGDGEESTGPRIVEETPAEEPAVAEGTDAALEGDTELVAYALEHWELLSGDDLDLLLASLDPLEQAWIDVAGEEAFEDSDAEGGTDAPR